MARTKQTARESGGGKAPARVETLTVEDALKTENDALKVTNNKLNDQNVDLNDENETLHENNEALKHDMEKLREELKIIKDLVAVQSNVIQMYIKKSAADEKLLKDKNEEIEFLRESLVKDMEDPEESEEPDKDPEESEEPDMESD